MPESPIVWLAVVLAIMAFTLFLANRGLRSDNLLLLGRCRSLEDEVAETAKRAYMYAEQIKYECDLNARLANRLLAHPSPPPKPSTEPPRPEPAALQPELRHPRRLENVLDDL